MLFRSQIANVMLKALEANLPPAPPPPPQPPAVVDAKEVQDDYDFSRKSYRDLVDKSNQAIEAMLDLATLVHRQMDG